MTGIGPIGRQGVLRAGFLGLAVFWVGSGAMGDSPYAPRVDFGQLLEPKGDRILHGCGALSYSDWSPMHNYIGLMYNNVPVLAMSWVTLNLYDYDISVGWNQFLATYPDRYILPQIGLNFNESENPNQHYEDDVANGLYDDKLREFLTDLQKINRPLYLRVALGFNGEWNNYNPDDYKRAWRRTWDIKESLGIQNIAFVWDYLPFAASTTWAEYYPGDDVVDWWALEIFNVVDVSRPNTAAFLTDARAHRKPVMIAESTAFQVGSTNPDAWTLWYQLFFDFIRSNSEIKAVCYINWDWRKYPQWSSWGDCRLESNTTIALKYYNEVSFPVWLHARGRSAILEQLYAPFYSPYSLWIFH